MTTYHVTYEDGASRVVLAPSTIVALVVALIIWPAPARLVVAV